MDDIDAGKIAPPVALEPAHFAIGSHTPLYHWSPATNRDSIQANGLRIRRPAVDGSAWRPPFIALASTPQLGWALSAGRLDYEVDYDSWDLWMTWDALVDHMESIPFDDGEPREYRVYKSIPAKRLWFVGNRRLNDG